MLLKSDCCAETAKVDTNQAPADSAITHSTSCSFDLERLGKLMSLPLSVSRAATVTVIAAPAMAH